MDLAILGKYQGHFPSCSDLIADFPDLYKKKYSLRNLDCGMSYP